MTLIRCFEPDALLVPCENHSGHADVLGKFSVWRNPIPVASYNVPPTGGETTLAQAAATTQADLNSLFDDDPDDIDAVRRRRVLKVSFAPSLVLHAENAQYVLL